MPRRSMRRRICRPAAWFRKGSNSVLLGVNSYVSQAVAKLLKKPPQPAAAATSRPFEAEHVTGTPRGKFITFEGGEGAGKTTQSAFLADRLRRAGISVLQTREPGGTPRAEAIREVLLSGKAKKFGPLGEAVLFYAARESHLELAIRPALERGTWVICDRFSDLTRAYQGAAGGPAALRHRNHRPRCCRRHAA